MKKIRRQKAMQLRIRQNKKKQEEDQKRPTNKKQAEKIYSDVSKHKRPEI